MTTQKTEDLRDRLEELVAELDRQDAVAEEARAWLGASEADIACARFPAEVDDVLDAVFEEQVPPTTASPPPPTLVPYAVRA